MGLERILNFYRDVKRQMRLVFYAAGENRKKNRTLNSPEQTSVSEAVKSFRT